MMMMMQDISKLLLAFLTLTSEVVTSSGLESSRLNRNRWGNHEAGKQHLVLGGHLLLKMGDTSLAASESISI